MEELKEQYKRKIQYINELIDKVQFKDDANVDYVRLVTKRSCYQQFIMDLEYESKKMF